MSKKFFALFLKIQLITLLFLQTSSTAKLASELKADDDVTKAYLATFLPKTSLLITGCEDLCLEGQHLHLDLNEATVAHA